MYSNDLIRKHWYEEGGDVDEAISMIEANLQEGDHYWASEYAHLCRSEWNKDKEAAGWYVVASDYGIPDTCNYLFNCDERIIDQSVSVAVRSGYLLDYWKKQKQEYDNETLGKENCQ